MTNLLPPDWYANEHGHMQWWDGAQWGALQSTSLDSAGEWSGKMWGAITGLAGGVIIYLASQSWRVCGSESLGPKTTTVFRPPFEPMQYFEIGLPLGEGQRYCAPAFEGNLTLLGAVLGLAAVAGGLFYGMLRDRGRSVAKRAIPPRPAA